MICVSACAVNTQSADVLPSTDVSKLKSFYVVKFGPDGRDINILLKDRLIAMGYAATTGPEGSTPGDVDAVVTYRDKWVWDLAMYMLSLDVTLRDPKTGFPLATAKSLHTSLTRKSPEAMVQETLGNILKGSRS
jgi:hypothetical protein